MSLDRGNSRLQPAKHLHEAASLSERVEAEERRQASKWHVEIGIISLADAVKAGGQHPHDGEGHVVEIHDARERARRLIVAPAPKTVARDGYMRGASADIVGRAEKASQVWTHTQDIEEIP